MTKSVHFCRGMRFLDWFQVECIQTHYNTQCESISSTLRYYFHSFSLILACFQVRKCPKISFLRISPKIKHIEVYNLCKLDKTHVSGQNELSYSSLAQSVAELWLFGPIWTSPDLLVHLMGVKRRPIPQNFFLWCFCVQMTR